jgi:hypothetical protein
MELNKKDLHPYLTFPQPTKRQNVFDKNELIPMPILRETNIDFAFI